MPPSAYRVIAWEPSIALSFFQPLCRKKRLEKAVACTMIFNTASTITNLSLNSRNRLISCSVIGLLIGFLVFYLMKISFVKPEACAIIFNTASPVNQFMKQRNKKIKNVVYVAAHAPPFLFVLTKTFGETTTTSSIPNISKFHFFCQYRFFISLFHKFIYR